MNDTGMTPAQIFTYDITVPIARAPEDVWPLLSERINDWWMTDFRLFGETSTVTLDMAPGGTLLERGTEGELLEWYRVQMVSPGKSLYLVGYMAADWGGPTVSMLKLGLEADGGHTILTVTDSLLGNVTDKAARNAEEGWKLMFGSGLKDFAEAV